MRLRSNLLLLVGGTVVPLLALALVLGFVLVEHEKETTQNGAMARTRAFMTAVDAELSGHVLSLQGLATSRSLQRGDLRTFQEEIARFLKSQPDWRLIILHSPEGVRRLAATGSSPAGSSQADFVHHVDEERKVWEALIKAKGIKAE